MCWLLPGHRSWTKNESNGSERPGVYMRSRNGNLGIAGVLQHPETAWRFGLTQRVSLVVVSLVFDSVFVHQASSER